MKARIYLCFLFCFTVAIDETDPNHVNVVFKYLDSHPEQILSISIKEKQYISKNEKECLQYDYLAFRWLADPKTNPFPHLTTGKPYCTELKCDDIFGPAKRVNCDRFFEN